MDKLDIPANVKVLMTFINRVGFPIFAFILMFGVAMYTLLKITPTIQQNTQALSGVQSAVTELRETIKDRRG